ncbi:hypothetical protein DBR32_02360 [Taibaiella sp. KBW10]|uniref:hypothetical protein n=1 Tax=Taibaiella sp. KBW10 TaxID=2153357 RepID=UPI000F5B51E2|nr:hypothetical protein [Taibaiella sp. KBW10]RQO32467.1 hypothetical protein DBR32_02360 [Taibaiella sp. KBW10]
MKKIVLAALALIGTYSVTTANVLTIYNLTPCTYTLNSSGPLSTIPPGTSTFISPVNDDFHIAKVVYEFPSYPWTSVAVGMSTPYANSAGQPVPPCLTNPFYTASWSQASITADATLVIF